jgi:CHAT domain-containing protein/tetratricopeptide (TPR) repeat protein
MPQRMIYPPVYCAISCRHISRKAKGKDQKAMKSRALLCRYSAKLFLQCLIIVLLVVISHNSQPALAGSGFTSNAAKLEIQSSQNPDPATDPRAKLAVDAYNKGMELSRQGNAGSLKAAIEKLEEAVKLFQALNKQQMQAHCLEALCRIANALDQKQRALSYCQQALLLFQAVGYRRGEAFMLTDMGSVYSDLGDKKKALSYYDQALPIHQTIGNRGGEAYTRNNIGLIYRVSGDKQRALSYLNQALQIHKEIRNYFGEATALGNIGLVYADLGELDKALSYYNQGLAIRRKFNDRSGEAHLLNSIGSIYSNLNETEKALSYFNQALPIHREAGDLSSEAGVLVNLGLVYADLGDWSTALSYYNQALPIYRAIPDRRGEATTLVNIGAVYDATGDKQKALSCFYQALPIYQEVSDRDGEASALNNLGNIYDDLGDRQQALSYYNQGLPIYKEIGDRAGEAIALHNLMLFWEYERQLQLATFFGKQSVNIYQSLRADISSFDRQTQQTYLDSFQRTYRLLADLLIAQKRFSEAEFVMNLLKQFEYFEYARHSDAEIAKGAKLIAYGKKELLWEKRYNEIANQSMILGQAFSNLAAKPLKYRTAEDTRILLALLKDLGVIRQSFNKYINDIAKEFSTSALSGEIVTDLKGYVNLQNLLKTAEKGTVVVFTLVGEKKYRIVLVTPYAYKEESFDITGKELSARIFQFRETLQNSASNPATQAQQLYKILIGAKMAKYLEEAKAETVLWSLDGALRYLPIAALHDGKQYLVERYRNVVITLAGRGFLEGKEEPKKNRQVAALGVSKAFEGFPVLSWVKEELESIVRNREDIKDKTGILPGIIKMNDDFNEDALQMALLNHYQILHIATHFNLVAGNDADSFLLLGNGKKLSLAEINGYDFNGIELLNLSACDTGMGSPGDGSEIEGFGMKAQRKGARAVMATLWNVTDNSTSLFMQKFYKLWQQRTAKGGLISKAEAIRQAQLAFLRGDSGIIDAAGRGTKNTAGKNQDKEYVKGPLSHPYYWAPFILIGNAK